jgi:DNA modification methylase
LRNYGVSGQIGLECTPEKYIERLIEVFTECQRVLKDSGTMWVVIGDSYAGSGRGIGNINIKGIQQKASFTGDFLKPYKSYRQKNKDLFGIPWLLALALRDAGWYLRQDIIWHKPNPMPESVTDRCTKSHEYIFLFSKSQKYYFNHVAMLEPAKYDGRKSLKRNGRTKYANSKNAQTISRGWGERWQKHNGQFVRNKRSVWTIPTRAFKGAHFATFPPDIVHNCIIAGCPLGGLVLDPFIGSGTTAVVAANLGRNYIGIELNNEYVKLAEDRIKNEVEKN